MSTGPRGWRSRSRPARERRPADLRRGVADLATSRTHLRLRLRADLNLNLAGTAAGQIRSSTNLDERRLWEQFGCLMKRAGPRRMTR